MEYQRLLILMEIRYGENFLRELKEVCQLTDDDFENVKIIFEYSISKLDKYYQLKMSTLKVLQYLDPSISKVTDDIETVSESDLVTINNEVNTMRQILQTLK